MGFGEGRGKGRKGMRERLALGAFDGVFLFGSDLCFSLLGTVH